MIKVYCILSQRNDLNQLYEVPLILWFFSFDKKISCLLYQMPFVDQGRFHKWKDFCYKHFLGEDFNQDFPRAPRYLTFLHVFIFWPLILKLRCFIICLFFVWKMIISVLVAFRFLFALRQWDMFIKKGKLYGISKFAKN